MDEPATTPSAANEERILRFWTPILLRTILIAAAVVLIAGLILMTTKEPGYYLQRYHAAQHADYAAKATFAQTLQRAAHGDPHQVLVLGLYVLTLVPLARVAFCFLLFIEER